MDRICKNCGISFPVPGTKKVFCNRRCREEFYNPTPIGPKLSPGTLGAISELLVASDLLAKGYEVFRALSPSCSCDLAILMNGRPLRIEVRSGYKLKDGQVKCGGMNIKADVLALVVKGTVTYKPSFSQPANQPTNTSAPSTMLRTSQVKNVPPEPSGEVYNADK